MKMDKEMPEEIYVRGYDTTFIVDPDNHYKQQNTAYIRKDKYDALLARLELDYQYDIDGNRVKIQDSENTVDGIEARDATIELLERHIGRLNKALEVIANGEAREELH